MFSAFHKKVTKSTLKVTKEVTNMPTPKQGEKNDIDVAQSHLNIAS